MKIKNGLVFRGKQGFVDETLYIQDGFFADTASGETVDADGCYVIPGLVDVHFHGAAGYDFCDGTPEALASIASYELAQGVTSICPATMTLGEDRLIDICKNAAAYHAAHSGGLCGGAQPADGPHGGVQPAGGPYDGAKPAGGPHGDRLAEKPDGARLADGTDGGRHTGRPDGAGHTGNPHGARLAGIHLEGPFISAEKKGAQNPDYIIGPSIGLLHRLTEASSGLVRLITVAPEADGAMEFIPEAARTVHVSIGHTACDYDTAATAISLGADHLTHTFNAMPPLSHRAPGPIAAGAMASVMAEVICDGIHVHPAMIKSLLRLYGTDRVVFISDSMRATGMPDGTYDLGGLAVDVSGPRARLSDGTIAGSVSNLMQCMKKAVSMGIPLETAVACSTINPARSIGIDGLTGSLDTGKYADCLLLERDTLEIRQIVAGGVLL